MTRRRAPFVAAAVCSVLALSGCKFEGAASFPLPGGEGGGDGAYELTLQFPDVLDLVKQSSVKVDDVSVGSVTDISLDKYTAIVKVKVKKGIVLPQNSRASLRQTSLLGEKFVSLDRPTGERPLGQLRNGDTIPLSRTSRNAEIEEVLGALSLVLNGGSLEQIQVINKELIAALQGREGEVKDVFRQLDTFVGGLDAQKQDIVRALDSLDRLTARLADQRETLAVALRDIPGGTKVLADQRSELTTMLTGLDKLGKVASDVIGASQKNTVADLKALQPILQQLNKAGGDLPKALELLTTYPFPRTVDKGILGDDANLFLTVDLDPNTIAKNLQNSGAGLPNLPLTIPTALPTTVPTIPVPTVPAPGGGGLPVPSLPAPTIPAPGGSLPSVPVPTVSAPATLPPLPVPPLPLNGLSSAAENPDLVGLLLGGLK